MKIYLCILLMSASSVSFCCASQKNISSLQAARIAIEALPTSIQDSLLEYLIRVYQSNESLHEWTVAIGPRPNKYNLTHLGKDYLIKVNKITGQAQISGAKAFIVK